MARQKHTRTVEPCQIERSAPLPTPPPPAEVRAWLDRRLLDGIKTTVQVALDALFALLHFGKVKHNEPPFQMRRWLALF